MNRTEGRQAIAQLLELSGLFKAVLQGRPDSFGGKHPVAVVSSAGSLGGRATRGVLELVDGWVIRIYVQRPANEEEATEDTLDELVRATIVALLTNGDFAPQQSNATIPNRLIDDKMYRVEEIPVTLAHNA